MLGRWDRWGRRVIRKMNRDSPQLSSGIPIVSAYHHYWPRIVGGIAGCPGGQISHLAGKPISL